MNELAKKSIVDLKKELAEKREEVRVFRFGTSGAAVRNVKGARVAKREVARILTELRARELAK